MVLALASMICTTVCSNLQCWCRLATAAKSLVGVMQLIVNGNESLQIPSGLLDDPFARRILLDPVCLRQDSANCLATTNPFYSVSVLCLQGASLHMGNSIVMLDTLLLLLQAVNQGLEAAINNYASAALALAEQPVSDVSINNSYVLFISAEASTDIYEGIDTLANHMIAQVSAINSRVETIEVRLWYQEMLLLL